MRLFRLVDPRFAPGLDGEGARRYPGRWNPPGRAMCYCATSGALAVLETFVHLPPAMRRADALPKTLLVTLDLDPAAVTILDQSPPDLEDRRRIGLDWLDSARSPALQVRSHVVPCDWNVLLNPEHPDLDDAISNIQQDAFVYDPRLAT